MGRHTVVGVAGRRVEVQPCNDSKMVGLVRVQILGADRQALGFVTLTADGAAILAQALTLEAKAAELREVAAVPVVALPAEIYKPNIDKNCDCGAASHVGAFRPPCTCHLHKLTRFGAVPALSAALDRYIAAGV
jgi:hypothetical protein